VRLSVICPVFNTPPPLLTAAVQSVLAAGQAHVAELLLVDDGSHDPGTRAALDRLAAEDPRIRLLRQATSSGPSAARDAGVRAAGSEWIGFADSDDLWLPGRVEAVVELLRTHQQAEWIAGHYGFIMADGSRHQQVSPVDRCEGERLGPRAVRFRTPELTRLLIANNWIHLGGTMVRKELLLRAGGFVAGLYYGEDCYLFMKLSVLADLYFVEDEAYLLRRQGDSLMTSGRRLSSEYARVYDVARAEPLLRPFARELRWARYGALKGLALNNLLSDQPAAAIRHALRAWLTDPRELRDLARFAALMARRGHDPTQAELDAYSRVERFVVGAVERQPSMSAG
jgi:glycosyltransferase involved in cell wall biosynthesis